MKETDPPDILGPLQALLHAFRRLPTAPRRVEQDLLQEVLTPLNYAWNIAFPGFPATGFPHASARGIMRRGRRDSYLRSLLPQLLQDDPAALPSLVVNPACVFGRHARQLAARWRYGRVVATDINPWFNHVYGRLPWVWTPSNYAFERDDLFHPKPELSPSAVVFFGACGSLTDAAMDYAIQREARLLACRACCHDNIGGNTDVARRRTPLNLAFRLKNVTFRWIRRRRTGEYFSDRFPSEAYPRSQAVRQISSPAEFQRLSRHSVDSDLCRTVIDLDRAQLLVEHGYRVLYRGELFVARRRVP